MSFRVTKDDTIKTLRRKVVQEVGQSFSGEFKVYVRIDCFGYWSGEPYDFEIEVQARRWIISEYCNVGDHIAFIPHYKILQVTS